MAFVNIITLLSTSLFFLLIKFLINEQVYKNTNRPGATRMNRLWVGYAHEQSILKQEGK